MTGRHAALLVTIGAGISAAGTLVMLAFGIDATVAVIILGLQIMLAFALWYLVSRSDDPKRPIRSATASQPPSQPPATGWERDPQPLDDMIIRLPNRPQPPATALDAVAQPPATAPQPPATTPQPQPQPAREPVLLPFPLQNGARREPRPRAEVPWQPAPWDVLLEEQQAAATTSAAVDDPAAAGVDALLPLRPPTAADYLVIHQALEDCQWSRRRACIVVYGRRDGLTYPWLRRVADFWEISEEDRPSILVWELLGTREIPGNLAGRLGLEMTADEVSAAIDAARLTPCVECDAWAVLDELDENDACTMCTA